MRTRPKTRYWWAWIGLATLVLYGTRMGFDEAVRSRLRKTVIEAAGPGHHVDIGRVRTNLFRGDIEVSDIVLRHDPAMTDSLLAGHRNGLVALNAEKVVVNGLSYLELFRHGIVKVRHLEVEGPAIHHVFLPGNDDPAPGNDAAKEPLPLIVIDSLIVRNATGSSTDLSGIRSSAHIGRLDIHLGRAGLSAGGHRRTRLTAEAARIGIHSVEVAFPPLYDLRIGEMELHHPSGSASAMEVRLAPRRDEHGYQTLVPYETDLFRAGVDTLLMEGLDVAGFLANNSLNLRLMRLKGAMLEVFRDKTMPDAPWTHKPLPASAIARIGMSLAVDTMEVHGGQVTYHERDTMGPGYGEIGFTALRATITGLDNRSNASQAKEAVLRVHANALVYGNSTVRLDYSAPLASPNDRFSMSLYLNSIPFTLFNKMTDRLLRVEATDGHIHTLTMHMHGDDRGGKGTVDLEYEALRIAIHRQGGSGAKGRVIGLLANTAVRKNNLRSRNNYRQGTFSIDRRRDRSLFNFLWHAVKAGSMDTVVPGILRKSVNNGQGGRTVRSKERGTAFDTRTRNHNLAS